MSFLKKLKGKWRLLFGFCPKCNSDAPNLYDCDVCNWYRTSESGMPSKETKKLWWKKYLHLLTLLLVIPLFSCGQEKWFKLTKNDWKLVGGSAAFGSFYAVNQSLVHHHLGRGNQYWDVNVSWKNKYKDFDNGDMSAKFFLSKSVLAPTTDGYHLTQLLYRTAGVVTLAFAIGDFDAYKRKDRWKIIGKKIVLCTLTERLFFNVLFAALGSH